MMGSAIVAYPWAYELSGILLGIRMSTTLFMPVQC